MNIQTNKSKCKLALIITTVLLAINGLNINNFFAKPTHNGFALLFCSVLICVVIGGLIACKFNFTNPKTEKIFAGFSYFLAPFVTMTMTECLNYIVITKFDFIIFVGNYFFYLLVQSIFYVFTNRIKWSIIISSTLLFAFGVANYSAITFRGSPFVPLDFLSISTALDVSSNYDVKLTPQLLISSMLFIAIILFSLKIKFVSKGLKQFVVKYSTTVIASILIFCTFYGTDIFTSLNIKADLWNQSRGYSYSGSALNFCLNTKYLYISEPKEYSPKKALAIANTSSDNSDDTQNTNKKKPNIIAIMNESFSDLSVLGDLKTTKDYMPFFNSLTDNAIKGNLFVSINGSGTSNSEFEFLTGNSMAFLPAGSNAYELYIKEETDSLVSILGDQGYSKTAIHPYYGSGWNRETVYPLLGFDDFISLEDLSEPEYIRQYVSDKSNYDTLIDLYENKPEDENMFLFNVTMQNHGGYTDKYDNFKEEVGILNPVGNYPKATQYLSIMKEADKAFKDLINYFEKEEEPTIILMFGDHQPRIESSFEQDLLGNNLNELDIADKQKRHEVPFVIWANYDIEEQYIPRMSANYLSTLLLETAELETSKYNDFLSYARKELPVINAIGYTDNNGVQYEYGQESPHTELLNDYQILQYNNMFDVDFKVDDIFSVFSGDKLNP